MDSNDATDRERSAIPNTSIGTRTNVSAGDTLAGRFLLREILGSGATGTVFSALDRSVGQKVAIKVLHPDLHDERTRERLRREVRASRNGHPNLVAVYDLHEADGHVFLSMELVEGRSLKDLLAESSRLEPPRSSASAGRSPPLSPTSTTSASSTATSNPATSCSPPTAPSNSATWVWHDRSKRA